MSWLKAVPKSASAKSIEAVPDRLMVVRVIGLPISLRLNISATALDSLAGEHLPITVQRGLATAEGGFVGRLLTA